MQPPCRRQSKQHKRLPSATPASVVRPEGRNRQKLPDRYRQSLQNLQQTAVKFNELTIVDNRRASIYLGALSAYLLS